MKHTIAPATAGGLRNLTDNHHVCVTLPILNFLSLSASISPDLGSLPGQVTISFVLEGSEILLFSSHGWRTCSSFLRDT